MLTKTSTFPRSQDKPSIWKDPKPEVVKEGGLSRTKITEGGGKKVRKSWGVVYAVLTHSHLSLYKELKSFTVRFVLLKEALI